MQIAVVTLMNCIFFRAMAGMMLVPILLWDNAGLVYKIYKVWHWHIIKYISGATFSSSHSHLCVLLTHLKATAIIPYIYIPGLVPVQCFKSASTVPSIRHSDLVFFACSDRPWFLTPHSSTLSFFKHLGVVGVHARCWSYLFGGLPPLVCLVRYHDRRFCHSGKQNIIVSDNFNYYY